MTRTTLALVALLVVLVLVLLGRGDLADDVLEIVPAEEPAPVDSEPAPTVEPEPVESDT